MSSDRSRINLRDDLEVGFWCRQLGCTRQQLFEAARQVGSMSGDVRRYLGTARGVARGTEPPVSNLVCEAIRQLALIELTYRGLARVVAPYCHGVSSKGVEMLRGIQVRGASSSGGLGFGKLWVIADLVEPRLLDERFAPDDPNYNPNDSAFTQIHCCVPEVSR